eukprot:2475094-Rhodomonas_salina.2
MSHSCKAPLKTAGAGVAWGRPFFFFFFFGWGVDPFGRRDRRRRGRGVEAKGRAAEVAWSQRVVGQHQTAQSRDSRGVD